MSTPPCSHAPVEREAELALRLEPQRIDGVAGALEVADHVREVLPDEVRQHEPVVQARCPSG